MSNEANEIAGVHGSDKSNPIGRTSYDLQAHHDFMKLPYEKRVEAIKEQWGEVAYVLVTRVKRLAMAGKVDENTGKLAQIATSAGIAHDKFMPKTQTLTPKNLIVQLFGTLPKESLMKVISPDTPSLEIEVENTDGD